MVARWFSTAAPRVMLVVLKRLAIGLLMVTAVFFIVTGRLSWLVYLAPPVFIWLMRFRSWARTAQTFANMSRGGGGGRTSDIRTRFLRLSLDHDSGVLSGEILEGTYVGRAIERLSRGELVDLLHACERDDLESVQVLEAYLDRIHPDWRARTGEAGGRGSSISGQIDRDEAYRVLGLGSIRSRLPIIALWRDCIPTMADPRIWRQNSTKPRMCCLADRVVGLPAGAECDNNRLRLCYPIISSTVFQENNDQAGT
jgi:hypothetical protein